MEKIKILIDNGHGANTLGKRSPDGRIHEYKYTRQFASMLDRSLTSLGLDSIRIVTEDTDVKISERVRRVNAWCKRLGKEHVLLVSLHLNAAGGDCQWHNARGWQVYVSKNASSSSKRAARLMTAQAESHGLVNPKSRQKAGYWTWSWRPDDIGLLKNTMCPAILTENLFQDNLEDVEYLLSEDGMRTLVQIHVQGILDYIKGKDA